MQHSNVTTIIGERERDGDGHVPDTESDESGQIPEDDVIHSLLLMRLPQWPCDGVKFV